MLSVDIYEGNMASRRYVVGKGRNILLFQIIVAIYPDTTQKKSRPKIQMFLKRFIVIKRNAKPYQ